MNTNRTADLMDQLATMAGGSTNFEQLNPGLIRETRQLANLLRAEANRPAAPARPEAKLPECTGFTGTGTRCESCRVRKAMHDA